MIQSISANRSFYRLIIFIIVNIAVLCDFKYATIVVGVLEIAEVAICICHIADIKSKTADSLTVGRLFRQCWDSIIFCLLISLMWLLLYIS